MAYFPAVVEPWVVVNGFLLLAMPSPPLTSLGEESLSPFCRNGLVLLLVKRVSFCTPLPFTAGLKCVTEMGGVGSELEFGESKFINLGLASGGRTVAVAAGTAEAAIGEG